MLRRSAPHAGTEPASTECGGLGASVLSLSASVWAPLPCGVPCPVGSLVSSLTFVAFWARGRRVWKGVGGDQRTPANHYNLVFALMLFFTLESLEWKSINLSS